MRLVKNADNRQWILFRYLKIKMMNVNLSKKKIKINQYGYLDKPKLYLFYYIFSILSFKGWY